MKKIEMNFAAIYTHLSTFCVGKWRYINRFRQLFSLALLVLIAGVLPAQSADYSSEELHALSKRSQHAVPLSSSVIGIDPAALMERARTFETRTKNDLQAALSPILNVTQHHEQAAHASGIMVFASLSMPRTSLRQLLMQSEQLQVPIIIRGVLPEGFTATVKQINQLINNQGQPIQSGFAINPNWFTQFGITQVPAFVVIKPNKCQVKQPCGDDDFDVIYGNVSMYDALTLLAQHGLVPDVAANALAQHVAGRE